MMRWASPLTCFWPGLSRLWLRGDWRGLITATAFAGLLNFALMASFIRPELVATPIKVTVWLLVAGFWIVATRRQLGRRTEFVATEHGLRQTDVEDDLFRQVQTEYLKGHWFEAETLLQRLLESCDEDVEARLMLATLYRHTRRLDEAEQQLQQLSQLDVERRWQEEIENEKQLLARLVQERADQDQQESREIIEPNAWDAA